MNVVTASNLPWPFLIGLFLFLECPGRTPTGYVFKEHNIGVKFAVLIGLDIIMQLIVSVTNLGCIYVVIQ